MEIHNYNNFFFHPNNDQGLEKLVIFPDGEFKRKGLPNSSVWAYDINKHDYDPFILGPDVGCGIAGFKIPKIDHKLAADLTAEFLKDKNVLGRGNHFIDFCDNLSPLSGSYDDEHSVMLLHSDGKAINKEKPKNYESAEKKQRMAKQFRIELGEVIASKIGVICACFGDWPHNTVEISDSQMVYRKGAIKTNPGSLHILPSHMIDEVFVYTVSSKKLPPLQSMPHGSGRSGPISYSKVDIDLIEKLREDIYIPDVIPSSSLTADHPICFNESLRIIEELYESLIPVGGIRIRSYVGKI